MDDSELRPLKLERRDVSALLAVEHLSLNDSHYTPDEALDVLRQPGHWAFVACRVEKMLGFIFCFQSQGSEGPQLELDMLGVVPEERRRGLATRLITYARQQAAALVGAHEAPLAARAVVQHRNAPSRLAFEHAGLHVAQRAQLLVYEIGGVVPVVLCGTTLDRGHAQARPGLRSSTSSAAAWILASCGRAACSRFLAYGRGTSAIPTRPTGASRSLKQALCMRAASSALTP